MEGVEVVDLKEEKVEEDENDQEEEEEEEVEEGPLVVEVGDEEQHEHFHLLQIFYVLHNSCTQNLI